MKTFKVIIPKSKKINMQSNPDNSLSLPTLVPDENTPPDAWEAWPAAAGHPSPPGHGPVVMSGRHSSAANIQQMASLVTSLRASKFGRPHHRVGCRPFSIVVEEPISVHGDQPPTGLE